ncbi:hypothetical protein [Luteimonas sp. A501]
MTVHIRAVLVHAEAKPVGPSLPPVPERKNGFETSSGLPAAGAMYLPQEQQLDSIAATTGMLVDDDFELRLLRCFRRAPVRARVLFLEMVELIAPDTRRQRTQAG